MKKIDSEIKQKNNRIEYINSEKVSIAKQIDNINSEIKEIEKDAEKLQEEIKVVNRNIEYGGLNLNVSSKVLDKKKSEYKAKMIEVTRKSSLESDTRERSIAKRSFSRLLYGDLESMEHIKKVQSSIEQVKKNIENDRQKLTVLKRKLDSNRRSIETKKQEKNRLIAKLNQEKTTHVQTISKLQVQKKNIEKEIEKIIKARSVSSKNVKLHTAVANLGKFLKPISGRTVVKFKEKKNGEVISNGIEIAGKMGEKVKSAMGGKVIYADKFQGLNNVVMIDYGYNTIGVYGNLIAVGVKLNQQVKKGQDIGVLGLNTDSKANLYYEVRFNLKPINPENLF
ncbi:MULTISPECIES: murein hydrolase activator EnvC family protein [Cetobacterium]|uniref:Peptidoglycan DD-metalloendopeptidase family protein n=1 Tax=Candidatus Cetobacterium colombiensis TaxID=3073100 RepID=A0ABU4WBT2_9FUSO|nr:peptidoglycan DD-metalloendopeptidase family protein [Candidatus Cetobacterium colombiensis]MDX8337002.1 peptidoglycan DD-metalloendopeptidase family protein [Candidatus Cetobacterium colombiensis]